MKVKVKRLSEQAYVPTMAHATDAGFDLYATKCYTLYPNHRQLVTTDIAIEMPDNYYADVRGRSGNTIKRGLVVPTGTIDAGYRGNIGVMVFNLSNVVQQITEGERIGQLVFHQKADIEMEEADHLTDTDRGTGGYGSSGK